MPGVRKPMPGVVYMPDQDIARYVQAGVYTDETLIGAYRASFARHADRVALSEPGTEISYRELDEMSDRGAAALWRLGLRPLDRAVFQMRNSKELFYAFFSCLKIGVIPVCTLAAHREAEIGYLGRHARAKAHFVHGDDGKFDLVGFARRMREDIPTMEHILVAPPGTDAPPGDTRDFMALIAAEDAGDARALVDGVDLDPYQVVLFQLSGGTSGIPKIIPRFHNEYRYSIGTVIDCAGLDETMVAFTPNPHMHNAPMIQYWGPALMVGGEVAIPGGRMALDEIEKVMAARRPTWIALAKVHMVRLAEAGAFDRMPLDQVKGFIVTDSAVALREMIGAPCLPIFGMTEGLLCITRPDAPEAAFDNCVGQPLSPHDEVRIVEPGTERDLPFGEAGELLVRGPSVLRGYYDAPERNAEAITADGFYRSGDLLRFRDVEGERYLSFEGRVKDVVDRGGEKINCSEVENALALHPDVGAVACVPMPDPLYGERMCAFVVPKEGRQAPDVAAAGRFLERQGLAKFKWPERIEAIDDLPMTRSGKVSKPLMREIVTAKLAEEAATGNGSAQDRGVVA